MGMDCQLHGPLELFPRLMHRQAAKPAPDQDMEAQRCNGCCIAPRLSAQELFYGLSDGGPGLAAERRGGTPGFFLTTSFGALFCSRHSRHLACRFLRRSAQLRSAALGLPSRLEVEHLSSVCARRTWEKPLIINRLFSNHQSLRMSLPPLALQEVSGGLGRSEKQWRNARKRV